MCITLFYDMQLDVGRHRAYRVVCHLGVNAWSMLNTHESVKYYERTAAYSLKGHGKPWLYT